MIDAFKDLPKVYLCLKPTDMRKSIDGLTALVVEHIHENPQKKISYSNKTKPFHTRVLMQAL